MRRPTRNHVSITVRITAPDNRSQTLTARDGRITQRGTLDDNGLEFESQLQVRPDGGWRTDNADDPEDQHRHVSHLYALHPDHQIAPYTDPKYIRGRRVAGASRRRRDRLEQGLEDQFLGSAA